MTTHASTRATDCRILVIRDAGEIMSQGSGNRNFDKEDLLLMALYMDDAQQVPVEGAHKVKIFSAYTVCDHD